MRMYLSATMALFALVAICIANVTAISDEPVLKAMQADNEVNETQAEQMVLKSWNSFVENFDYQGTILNETLSGNMTYPDAMVSTVALFVLNSQALAESESFDPGDKYADFHSYTMNAMSAFDVYLYNMAKLFETKNGKYSRTARDAFNITMDYYTKGKDEAEFVF